MFRYALFHCCAVVRMDSLAYFVGVRHHLGTLNNADDVEMENENEERTERDG